MKKGCVFLFSVIFLLCSCSVGNKGVKTYLLYDFFDTVSSFYIYTDKDEDAVFSEVRSIVRKYHELLDIYNEYDGINNICTVNKNAGIQPVEVDRELLDLILFCRDFCELTGNSADISAGSVFSLWHHYREDKISPDSDELKQRALHTGFDKIVVDYGKSTVYITDPLCSVDFGSVGKGFACEKIGQYLEGEGITSYAINLGGNVKVGAEKPGSEKWNVGIRDPHNNSGIKLKLSVENKSVVTSGGYERFYEVNGETYHHIIDLNTLFPASYYDSVTVVCENSLIADLLSTALFCSSIEKGQEITERIISEYELETLEVAWIYGEELTYTDGLANFIL